MLGKLPLHTKKLFDEADNEKSDSFLGENTVKNVKILYNDNNKILQNNKSNIDLGNALIKPMQKELTEKQGFRLLKDEPAPEQNTEMVMDVSDNENGNDYDRRSNEFFMKGPIKKEYWETFKDPYGGLAAIVTSFQAIEYSKNEYGYRDDGTPQNALQHALWNALMTVNIGYDRAKKFADAHEVLPQTEHVAPDSNGFFPEQNSEMDYYYNELGRQAALEFVEEYKKLVKYGKKIDDPIKELTKYVNNKIQQDLTRVLIRR